MNKKRSIKSRIVVSVLLLISSIFIGILIAFNVIMNKSIEKSSYKKLQSIKYIAEEFKSIQPPLEKHKYKAGSGEDFNPLHIIKGLKEQINKENLQSDVQIMMIDKEYNTICPSQSDEMLEDISIYTSIARELKDKEIELGSRDNIKAETKYGHFYITTMKIDITPVSEEYYFVFFIDVSNTLHLEEKMNYLLLFIMIIASILSFMTSITLAKRIASPIQQLCGFAERIGEGDFKKCNFQFKDRELDELLKIMNKSAADLDKYDKEQKIFFQNASHELRTPLMSIKGYAEAIKYDVLDKNTASDIILEEGNRLGELIEELLYISKIDNITKDFVLEEKDLREVLSNCVLSQKAIAINKGIEFVYKFDENPVMFTCDNRSIYKAFSNIINNSLRYADNKIIIRCTNEEEFISISIENDGEKIAEESIKYVFDRFYKGKNGKNGIGLSIVKSIINEHDGKIDVENTELGVKFTIVFKK